MAHTFHILLNRSVNERKEENGYDVGYRPGITPLERVYHTEAVELYDGDVSKTLEKVFDFTNDHSSDEFTKGEAAAYCLSNRPLRSGDVVVMDQSAAFAVMPMGWSLVPVPRDAFL